MSLFDDIGTVGITPSDFMAHVAKTDPESDCWRWVKCNCSELWSKHIAAYKSGDMYTAKTTYNAMIAAYTGRTEKQLTL